jgi:HAD superfamily hydrolase (TIGR01509 family)
VAQLKAIFFDQDGVIIDTERDGHRVSFNETFRDFGYGFAWGVDEYHELLQISGGKERMKHYLQTKGFGKPVAPADVDDLIARMHKRKTALFIEMVESGRLPLRPGIHRFMKEALSAGLRLGVCTTSSETAANAIAYQILKDITFDVVLAGDIVEKKKPAPDIYNLALERTGLRP